MDSNRPSKEHITVDVGDLLQRADSMQRLVALRFRQAGINFSEIPENCYQRVLWVIENLCDRQTPHKIYVIQCEIEVRFPEMDVSIIDMITERLDMDLSEILTWRGHTRTIMDETDIEFTMDGSDRVLDTEKSDDSDEDYY